MSWLSSFWDHNRSFLGNALKNVAPAAFLIPGVGPLAAAGIAGAGSALGRGIQKGANIGDILKQGVTGAGQAYLGGQLTGGQGQSLAKLKSLFSTGGSGSPAAEASRSLARMPGVQFTPSSAVVQGPGSAAASTSGPRAASASAVPAQRPRPPRPASPGLRRSSPRRSNSRKDNPMAAALGLQGAGAARSSLPAENRLKAAQQQQLELQNQAERDDMDRQAARDKALEPLWKLLQAQLEGYYTKHPLNA